MAAKKVTKKESAGTKISLNTILFKDMVARARKGASNNSILPLTSMMAIELKDNTLTLTTTDMTNFLYVIQNDVKGNDFYATVMSEVFCQLVAKTTSDNITLELKDNYLQFTGNGTYNIDLPVEEGEVIKFPDPRNDSTLEQLDNIQLSSITNIVNSAKASLALTMEEPCLTGYYCGGNYTIASDTYKLCKVDEALWETPRLIPAELMDLLTLITDNDIQVYANEDTLLFTSSNCQVYGKVMDCIDDYPAKDIKDFIDCDFRCSCTVDKATLLQLLDRLSLFVAKGDKNEINLSFTEDGLEVSSKASTGVELVKYIASDKDVETFACVADIEMLNNQLKSIASDNVEIQYHNVLQTPDGSIEDNALKFVEDGATVCISLMENEQ